MSADSHEDLGIVLAMVHVAWSDKALDETELELVQTEARDQGLDEEEVGLLRDALLRPPSVEVIARYLTTDESRKAAALAAYATALADHKLTFEEMDAFEQLCAGLGLSDSEQNEVRTFAEREVRLARAHEWEKALLLEEFAREEA